VKILKDDLWFQDKGDSGNGGELKEEESKGAERDKHKPFYI